MELELADSTAFANAFAKVPDTVKGEAKTVLAEMSKASLAQSSDAQHQNKAFMQTRTTTTANALGMDDESDSDPDSDDDDDDTGIHNQAKAKRRRQSLKQERRREERIAREIQQSIDQVSYSSMAIFVKLMGRQPTHEEVVTCHYIDKEQAKFKTLRMKNKTKYGINTNAASLAKFVNVCVASDAEADAKRKRKRKIVIPEDSDSDMDAKGQDKSKPTARVYDLSDSEGEEEQDTQHKTKGKDEKQHETKQTRDSTSTSSSSKMTLKERLAKAWSDNLIPDPNAQGFCWIMDERERRIHPFFEGEDWMHIMTLEVFDDLIPIHGQLVRAWERASDPDLYDKVKGKLRRFKNQTQSQKGVPLPRSQVTWLQEAKNPIDMTKEERLLDLGTARSCQCNKVTRDGMTWRRSDGILDTVLIIFKEAYAICKEGDYFYDTYLSGKTSHEEEAYFYQSARRRTAGGKPSDMMTAKDRMYNMIRSACKGVGERLAEAIYNKYPMPRDLIHAYDACQDDDDREAMLAPLKLSNSKRTVGPVISRNIFESVYGSSSSRASSSSSSSPSNQSTKTNGASKTTTKSKSKSHDTKTKIKTKTSHVKQDTKTKHKTRHSDKSSKSDSRSKQGTKRRRRESDDDDSSNDDD